jgi:hypothetical protein
MNKIKYVSLVTIYFLSTMLVNFSFAYFEASFFCSFNKGELTITQTTHSWWRNCLELIAHFKTKESEITKLIDYMKEDSDYNKSAKSKLIKQRSEIQSLSNKTVQWVLDLESKLYLSYKKKYFNKIKPIRSKLIAKQAVLTADMIASLREWERLLVIKISSTIGFNYQRIKLIEWILTSKTLDEMMPLLQTYESIITQYVEWKSE